jgi:hypothetical protein
VGEDPPCVSYNSPVQVAIERVKEYIDLVREPPEFVEPRPPASWPAEGSINVKSLSIRYAVSQDVKTCAPIAI